MSVPMVAAEDTPKVVEEATDRVKDILDAQHAPVSAQQTLDASLHLSTDKKEQLRPLLEKHETLFDGTLGCWCVKHHVELKDPN